MDTINNVVNATSKAIWGDSTTKTDTTSTDTSVPRTMPDQNVTAGQEPLSGKTGNTSAGEPFDKGNEIPSTLPSSSSQQPSSLTTNTDPLGHTNKESEIGGPSSTAHSNVKEPGFTETTGHSEEIGARDDIPGSVGEERSHILGAGQMSGSDRPTELTGSTENSKELGEGDDIKGSFGKDNSHILGAGQMSSSDQATEQSSFSGRPKETVGEDNSHILGTGQMSSSDRATEQTSLPERPKETEARDDIKSSVGEDRSDLSKTGQVSTSDGPIERTGDAPAGIHDRTEKPEETGNPPAATSKNKNTNDETSEIAEGHSGSTGAAKDEKSETSGRGADKISILKTGQHPYGDANIPEVVAKDLKEGEHASEKLTGHPEGKGEQYATFTDPEAAASASGEDVQKMAESGKVDTGASGEKEDGKEEKEKLSMKDKIKAKMHIH